MPRTLLALTVALTVGLSSPGWAEGPDGEAAGKLRKMGGIVMPIAQDDDRLEVALHLADGDVTDETVDLIAKLDNVAWLNLAGTKVGDAGVAKLASLSSLERLHLERTDVTDASAGTLAGLPKLSYLNLYGTKLTDAGLKTLANSESLRKLFVWQTAVTVDAIAAASGDKLTVVGEVKLPQPEEKKPEWKKPEKKTPEAVEETSKPAADATPASETADE